MTSKSIFLVIPVFILTLALGKAQVSGYMGKTFELSYANQFFPSIQNINNGDFPLFTINSFRLEKVVTRHGSLLFSFNMFSAIVLTDGYYFKYEKTDQYGYQYTENFEPVGQDKTFTVQSKVFGLQYKIYTNDWLAPVGSYFLSGVSFLEGHSSDYLINSPEVKDITKNTTFNRVYLTFGYGKKWMLNNRLSFSLGVNSALSFDLNSFPFTISFGSSSNSLGNIDNAFQDLVKKRIRRMQFMNMEFGIGILLF